tara:strand:+ start:51 stop:722 length:672 start_codon:yes stop_codon:yes gene_type:complete
MRYLYTIFIFSYSFLFALPPLKDAEIDSFIIARYSGDTSMVNQTIASGFLYVHTPYVGLGVSAYYVDGSLLITDVVNDSIQTFLSVGDKIHEHNGKVVDKSGLNTNGAVGEEQKLIVTKAGDSTFSELNIPLQLFQYEQDSASFVEEILKYSDLWFDFDVTIKEKVIRKNKVFVHYLWEGSKYESGDTYYFSAMEILYLNKKRDLVERIEGIWSEKQFRDQFK